jgi:hypothetical protein
LKKKLPKKSEKKEVEFATFKLSDHTSSAKVAGF